jgi:heme-degrading monooxygenase HmoA
LIARIWRGAVRTEDREEYARYIETTGVRGYAETPGNQGIYMLRRDLGDRSEFVMFTLWDSLDSLKAFAGEDYETAVYYPEDDRYLVERGEKVEHFDVLTAPDG